MQYKHQQIIKNSNLLLKVYHAVLLTSILLNEIQKQMIKLITMIYSISELNYKKEKFKKKFIRFNQL